MNSKKRSDYLNYIVKDDVFLDKLLKRKTNYIGNVAILLGCPTL